MPPTIGIQRDIVKKIKLLVDFELSIEDEKNKINDYLTVLPQSVLSKAFKGELVAY